MPYSRSARMSGYTSGARRRLERTLPGMAAGDLRSYDLPDFRALRDSRYPPILLEAMERAGDRFERWNEQASTPASAAARSGYRERPSTWTGPRGSPGRVYTTDGG